MKENNTEPIVTCACGAIIPDSEMYYWNGCNELGEDYHTIEASCILCDKEHATSQWGNVLDLEEAKETLIEYFEIKKTI